MKKLRPPSIEPTGDAAVRLTKHLWTHLGRDTSTMRRTVGRRWITHEVRRDAPTNAPLHYEHIIPVLVFALRARIHGETVTDTDVFGCIVTQSEHQRLLTLRTSPNVLIPALACEKRDLLAVCARRYTSVGLILDELPMRRKVTKPLQL